MLIFNLSDTTCKLSIGTATGAKPFAEEPWPLQRHECEQLSGVPWEQTLSHGQKSIHERISFPLSVALVGIPLLGMELHASGQVQSSMEETRNTIRLSLEPDNVMFHFGNKKHS